ncbi:cell wall protein [Microbacterium deminutum]|uniref:Cell wall protein n=1 Tax=Microbacterium deminutum TaxID=344164 RepID=A0ABN2R7Z4_9MICO
MLGKSLAAMVVAAFIAVVPAAAYGDDESYAPSLHSEPSLDGSVVASQCIGDVPWISYSVVMTDPDNVATGHDPVLVISGGGNTTEIPLLTLDSSNQSHGKVLWPGASVDSAGKATGWPGWKFDNGRWVETDGNFAWTRGPITAVIRVNPELTVPLSYPPATAVCASPPAPPKDPGKPAALASTGSTFNPIPALYVGGGLIVLGGLTVLVVRRRAAKRR